MENDVRYALDSLHATDRMKRNAKAHIRKKTFDYGRNLTQLRQYQAHLAGCLAALALMVTCAGLWFTPLSTIGLDVNPSLELRVNLLDRAISLKGLNDDGREVAENLDVVGMTYEDAMTRILISDEMAPYLNQGKMISIAIVGGGTDAHAEEMLGKVVCRAYALADQETVYYCQADSATVRAAHEAGLSVAGYLAWQQLKAQNPNATPQDVLSMEVWEIRELTGFTELNPPCE